MSNLVEHAKRELEKTDIADRTGMYGGMLYDNILELVETFAKQGHSGGSASIVVPVLNKLLQFKPLTKLSDDPSEWMDRTEMSNEPLWQNMRDSSVFSKDGGKTWYSINRMEKV